MAEAQVRVEDLIALVAGFSGEQKLESVLDAILTTTRRLMRADGAAILLLDGPARNLHLVVVQHDRTGSGSHVTENVSLYDGNKPNLTEPHAFSALTGRPVVIEDVYRYTGFELDAFYQLDRQRGLKTGSMLIAPLRFADELTVGVMRITDLQRDANGKARMLCESETAMFQAIATLCAAAVRNARLRDENRRIIQYLERLNAEIAANDGDRKLIKAEQRALGAATRPVGASSAYRSAVNLVNRAAASRVAVLLLGETGTGKEVFARAIHALSGRSTGGFVVQNCAALPESLLESELFGHRKGAFTGAMQDKMGIIQEADGGTLFLDEIGDMPIGLQAKLLRFLQDGEVRPLGSNKSFSVNARIIAATNADLARGIENGTFRRDLFYRLNVFPINLPPLRERPSDIPALIDHFLNEVARSHQRKPPSLTPQAAEALLRWRYPGNVRELKNIIERALLLVDEDERIDLPHLPAEVSGRGSSVSNMPALIPTSGVLKDIMRSYESIVIEAKLQEVGGNRSRAARLLNISRRSLQAKIGRHKV